jgi:hypothetical protein
MKIRQGFVSNSSSSSFLIFTTEENHKKALSEMEEKRAKLLKFVGESEDLFQKHNFAELDCVCVTWATGNYAYPSMEDIDVDSAMEYCGYDNNNLSDEEYEEICDNMDEELDEALDDYKKIVLQNKKDSFFTSQDW